MSRALRWAAGLAVGAAAVALAVPSDGAVPIREGSAPGTYRGVIEGFYGPPWSHADRRSMIRWLRLHGLNTYVYAPKDDPFQRERWRQPYPDNGSFLSLAAAARQWKVRLVYSISPGLDMCYSAASDRDALLRKLGQLRSSGVRWFMLAFDDIQRSFGCPQDEAAYGSGDAALGRAHAEVANAVARWNPRGRLIVVPSDYAEVAPTPYLTALIAPLAGAIDVAWTGPYVVPSRVSLAHAGAVARIYGRLPVLWDNYPVNDFARDDLHLGPLAGRAPGLPAKLAGYLANPMNEAWASRIPLYTVAAYLRNPRRYRPAAQWRAAVQELGGRRGATVLRRLADNSQSSSTLDDPRPIWGRESSVLWARAVRAARSLRGLSWKRELQSVERRLRLEWRTLVELPRVVGARLAAELDPWARAVAANADLGRAAVAYVAATRPRFDSVRVRRRGAHWEVTGRIVRPTRAELDRLAAEVDATAAAVQRMPKETHAGSTAFLHGLAVARRSCAPTPVRLTLDGRRLAIGAGGRFRAGAAARPKRLVARDGHGAGTVHGPSGGTRELPAASTAARRARRQIVARLAAIAAAVRREDLEALGRYDERPQAVAAWRGLLGASRFPYARFPLGAFEAGALRCGGAAVAQVTWKLAGRVPPGVTQGKRANGTLGRPTVLLFSNRGTARAPDWRIVYSLPALP